MNQVCGIISITTAMVITTDLEKTNRKHEEVHFRILSFNSCFYFFFVLGNALVYWKPIGRDFRRNLGPVHFIVDLCACPNSAE